MWMPFVFDLIKLHTLRYKVSIFYIKKYKLYDMGKRYLFLHLQFLIIYLKNISIIFWKIISILCSQPGSIIVIWIMDPWKIIYSSFQMYYNLNKDLIKPDILELKAELEARYVWPFKFKCQYKCINFNTF